MITADELAEKLRDELSENVDEERLASQKRVWEVILKPGSSTSTLAVLPTGAGKSSLYTMIAKYNSIEGIVIVIEPLRSIIEDQISKFNDRSSVHADDINCLNNNKETALIYVSPEQLVQNGHRLIRKYEKIQMIVVDEVHTLFDWGSSFRNDFLFIPTFIELAKVKNKNLRVLLLTATLTGLQEDLCKKLIKFDSDSIIHDECPKLNSSVKRIIGKKQQIYNELISKHSIDYIDYFEGDPRRKELVFFRRKRDIECFLNELDGYNNSSFLIHISDNSESNYKKCINISFKDENGIEDEDPYLLTTFIFSGDLDAGEKKTYLYEISNLSEVLTICTKAFAMGVDLPELTGVTIVGIPESWNYYVQEIGRIRDKDLNAGLQNKISKVCYYSASDAVSMLSILIKSSLRCIDSDDAFVNVIERIKVWDYLCLWEWVIDAVDSRKTELVPDGLSLSLDDFLKYGPANIERKLNAIKGKDAQINNKRIDSKCFDRLFSKKISVNDLVIKELFFINNSKVFYSFYKDYPGLFNGGKARIISGGNSYILKSDINMNFFDFIVYNALYTHYKYYKYSSSIHDSRVILNRIAGSDCNDEQLLHYVNNSLNKLSTSKIHVAVDKGQGGNIDLLFYNKETQEFPLLNKYPELMASGFTLNQSRISRAFSVIRGRGQQNIGVNILSVYYTLFAIERHKSIYYRVKTKSDRKYTSLSVPYKSVGLEGGLIDALEVKHKRAEYARIRKKMKRILLSEYRIDTKGKSDVEIEDLYANTINKRVPGYEELKKTHLITNIHRLKF